MTFPDTELQRLRCQVQNGPMFTGVDFDFDSLLLRLWAAERVIEGLEHGAVLTEALDYWHKAAGR